MLGLKCYLQLLFVKYKIVSENLDRFFLFCLFADELILMTV